MDVGISFNTIFQFLLTLAMGFITWSLKELYNKIEKRQEAAETELKEIKQALNKNDKEMFKTFVLKDDHYRDINALEKKIDGIKDILLDMKEDLGKLTGVRERS